MEGTTNNHTARPLASGRALRVGYVPLTDAAPLLVARAFGLFEKHGVEVHLSREVGWATVRDKIIYRELDAAHAPAGMLFAMQLGCGCPPCDVLTAFVFNLHGNAITLAQALKPVGGGDGGAALREEVRRRRGERRLTFGVVFHWSSHHVQLREWLRSVRVDPDHDVRIVVVPPAQMHRNLAAGTLDGYCAGEPWNSLAAHAGHGWIVTLSALVDRGHIEKVLLVRNDFATARPEAHAGLVAALLEAAAWCDEPQNRESLVQLLALHENLDLPAEVIAPALTGLPSPNARELPDPRDGVIFHRGDANTPWPQAGTALLRQLAAHSLVPAAHANDSTLPRRLFRRDLFPHTLANNVPHEIQRP
jgi:two-component system, oxyanion-binding sensor